MELKVSTGPCRSDISFHDRDIQLTFGGREAPLLLTALTKSTGMLLVGPRSCDLYCLCAVYCRIYFVRVTGEIR